MTNQLYVMLLDNYNNISVHLLVLYNAPIKQTSQIFSDDALLTLYLLNSLYCTYFASSCLLCLFHCHFLLPLFSCFSLSCCPASLSTYPNATCFSLSTFTLFSFVSLFIHTSCLIKANILQYNNECRTHKDVRRI